MRVTIEYEEEEITDANNVTADTFSLASISHREKPNIIFASENIENLDKLVDTVANTTTSNVGY